MNSLGAAVGVERDACPAHSELQGGTHCVCDSGHTRKHPEGDAEGQQRCSIGSLVPGGQRRALRRFQQTACPDCTCELAAEDHNPVQQCSQLQQFVVVYSNDHAGTTSLGDPRQYVDGP